jgi:hypothetical protein
MRPVTAGESLLVHSDEACEAGDVSVAVAGRHGRDAGRLAGTAAPVRHVYCIPVALAVRERWLVGRKGGGCCLMSGGPLLMMLSPRKDDKLEASTTPESFSPSLPLTDYLSSQVNTHQPSEPQPASLLPME